MLQSRKLANHNLRHTQEERMSRKWSKATKSQSLSLAISSSKVAHAKDSTTSPNSPSGWGLSVQISELMRAIFYSNHYCGSGVTFWGLPNGFPQRSFNISLFVCNGFSLSWFSSTLGNFHFRNTILVTWHPTVDLISTSWMSKEDETLHFCISGVSVCAAEVSNEHSHAFGEMLLWSLHPVSLGYLSLLTSCCILWYLGY